MLGVKGGTKTWSDAPQRTDFKSDGRQTMSAGDKAKFFQDEDLGATLNKVADPNWVDPSKKMKTSGNNELGKDAFMSLLLTQMKNQDPTNPLKSHEMAAQLAQFTSLEKLTNIHEGIDGLRKDQEPAYNFQALAFIGKTVLADNSKINRTDTESRHDVRFNLPADATALNAQVKDAAGNVIRNLEFKNLKAGKNEINWNGITEDGATAPKGDYSISLEATGSNGRKLFVETKTEGTITGVNFTPQGPQLMIGKQVLSMSDVKTISVPEGTEMNTLSVPTSIQAPPAQGPKKAEVKPETKANGAKAVNLGQGNLNEAGMDQALINKLNKEGAKAGMG